MQVHYLPFMRDRLSSKEEKLRMVPPTDEAALARCKQLGIEGWDGGDFFWGFVTRITK